MDKFLHSLGFTSVALFVLTAVLTPLLTITIKWFKKTYREISTAKKNIENNRKKVNEMLNEITLRQKQIENDFQAQNNLLTIAHQKGVDSFKKEISNQVRLFKDNHINSLSRAFDRIDETRTVLDSVMLRIDNAMKIYDDKLYSLEKKLEKGLVSKEKYRQELFKIKDNLYDSINECLKKISTTEKITPSNLTDSTKQLLSMSKKVIECENKICSHEERIEYCEALISDQSEIIKNNEEKNTEINKMVKIIISRGLYDAKEESIKTISKVNEILNTHKTMSDHKINEVLTKQREFDDKIKKIENIKEFGKVIIKTKE